MIRLVLGLSLLLAGCVTTGDKPRKVDPEAARDAYIQLGIGYLQKGETERAKQPLSEALKLDPRSASANMVLALVFQQEGEYPAAEQHFRAALSADPANARILNNYGAFLLDRERYAEALSYFQKAAEDTLYSERSRVFENMGITYMRMGDAASARENIRFGRLDASDAEIEAAARAANSVRSPPATSTSEDAWAASRRPLSSAS